MVSDETSVYVGATMLHESETFVTGSSNALLATEMIVLDYKGFTLKARAVKITLTAVNATELPLLLRSDVVRLSFPQKTPKQQSNKSTLPPFYNACN